MGVRLISRRRVCQRKIAGSAAHRHTVSRRDLHAKAPRKPRSCWVGDNPFCTRLTLTRYCLVRNLALKRTM